MPAVRSAAYAAKRELLRLVAGRLGTEADGLDLRDGKVVRPDGKAGPGWKEACGLIEGDKLAAVGRRLPNFAAYHPGVAGCQIAEVEVDVETGQTRVVKVVAIHDCGQPLDRLTIESQVNGAVIQGMAYALLEERVMDRRTGRMLNANLETYKISGSLDVPEIEVEVFPVAAGANNLGSAGIGEPPVIPTAAAIANAIFDATGARCLELPMTPMRVLAALARREEGR
jgi:xanthine dehydrogenase YagR molybdenum-binding subunit